MLVNDREKYETFWKNFGRQIKFGIYGDYGMHKDLLGDLLMFYSAKEKKARHAGRVRREDARGAEVHLLCRR